MLRDESIGRAQELTEERKTVVHGGANQLKAGRVKRAVAWEKMRWYDGGPQEYQRTHRWLTDDRSWQDAPVNPEREFGLSQDKAVAILPSKSVVWFVDIAIAILYCSISSADRAVQL